MRYRVLYESGELLQRVKSAYARLRHCDLCPHDCGVDRIAIGAITHSAAAVDIGLDR